MILPATVGALLDRRLHRSDLRVYGYALDELDVMELRPMKLLAASHALHMHRAHVSRSLRRLVKLGYLYAEPRQRGNDYRLAYRPRLPQMATKTVA